jgi:hypothetical protein
MQRYLKLDALGCYIFERLGLLEGYPADEWYDGSAWVG